MTTTTSRRWSVWQLVTAVIALAAVAALIVTLNGRSGPPVIRISGSAGTAQGEALAAGAPADDAARLSFPAMIEFVLSDGARFPAGEVTAWRLEAPRDLRAAAVQLAAYFGLGEPTASPHGDGAYQAGPQDGSGPSLWVGSTGEWYYSDPSLHSGVACAEPAIPVEPDGGIGDSGAEDGGGVSGSTGTAGEPTETEDDASTPEDPQPAPTTDDEVRKDPDEDAPEPRPLIEPCPDPTPPSGVPTADEARRAAAALFADLGLPGTPEISEVYADEWGAWASATIPVDGRPTDLYASAGYGAEGALTSASGTLATVVTVGDYPTIDADEAVERLRTGGYWGGGVLRQTAVGTAESAVAAAGAVDAAASADPAVDPDAPVSSDDPVSILPAPEGEGETMTVRLVSAQPSLTLHFDADGTTWLLPGVRFRDDNGGFWQVMTVADGHIEFAEPEPAPLPVDPEPLPVEPPSGAEPDQPGEAEPGEPGDAGSEGASSDYEALAKEVVGLTEAEATDRILAAGAEPRVVSRDGEDYAVTDDYRTDRINLRIEDGIVVHADVG
ncbi:MAG: hypothetical protein ACRDUY_14535 [Nitriliruptorales bacterium]